MILYLGIILATAFFAIAYFSSYFAVQQINYASEFDMLPAELQNSDSGFSLVDVTDAAVSSVTGDDEDTLITPLGIGRLPSLPDTSRNEIEMYNVLRENDGPLSEAEKTRLTEKLHWQEYITGAEDTITSVAKEFNVKASDVHLRRGPVG